MDLQHEERLTAAEARGKSNTRRIEKLESQADALNRLATSVEVMASKIEGMTGSIERLDDKVEHIEAGPRKRWESVSEKVILAVVGAIAGALLAHFGL